MATSRKRDPRFSAAVLKVSFRMRGDDASEAFRRVYEGGLRDLGVTDEEVDAYLRDHREEIAAAARGQTKD